MSLKEFGGSMNDRELLELAAKAVGHRVRWHEDSYYYGPTMEVMEDESGGPPWNPLTDDGDALRLAVRLELKITHRCVDVDVSRGHASASEYVPTYFDRSEATRRAIVRAAAKIGEAAQKGTP